MTSTPPPPQSPLPSLRDAKQDRSLRLWGGDGQALLEAGHAVLLGGSSSGSEVLKNMILPGLGRFTIVDDAKVTKRDLGSNFFLDQSDLGADKAPALVRVLGELNPDSKGRAVVTSPLALIETDVSFFEREEVKIVIVSAGVPPASVSALSEALLGKDIHIMYVEGTGLVGVMRIQCDPRYIVDAVPDPDLRIIDLRIVDPFPELQAFFEKLSPWDQEMEIDLHSHLPWPLVMYHAVKKLREEKKDPAYRPLTPADFRDVRTVIGRMIRRTEPLQDNFVDAKSNATSAKLYAGNRNVPELQQILNDPRTAAPSASDAHFWFLAHGIKRFRDAHGCMPVSSDIPDFTSTTEWYLELKGIYKAQQERDVLEVLGYVRDAMAAAGLSANAASTADTLRKQVEQVCKHCWELVTLTFRPFAEEYAKAALVPDEFRNSSDPAFGWYVAHRAGRSFFQKNGRFVGSCADADLAADQAAMMQEVTHLLGGSASAAAPFAELAKEYVRYGGGEPVMIAAIIGAVAAQEAIKLLQNKRVPVCDALVYDGITARFSSFKC